jgi:hypothetical protein
VSDTDIHRITREIATCRRVIAGYEADLVMAKHRSHTQDWQVQINAQLVRLRGEVLEKDLILRELLADERARELRESGQR